MRYLTPLFFLLCYSASAQYHQIEEKGYVLKSIYFGGGSYYVDDVQITELNQLIDSIPNVKDFTITVHSHTDNIGGAAYNEWLSQMRSESVIHELLLSEFSMNQIQIKDFGQFNPVFDNSTWEGRLNNRRVDIIFWPIVF
jgi:outer membrane protein OmpA-like peptidoglycan-associated protein